MNWQLPSTSFWAQPLVEPRTDSSASMPYPVFQPGTFGSAADFPNRFTTGRHRHDRLHNRKHIGHITRTSETTFYVIFKMYTLINSTLIRLLLFKNPNKEFSWKLLYFHFHFIHCKCSFQALFGSCTIYFSSSNNCITDFIQRQNKLQSSWQAFLRQ